jgi:hypothetical protein
VNTEVNCSVQSLKTASVAYQKLSWRQWNASIIYLMATGLALPINVGAFLATAISLGWQKVPIKTQLGVQIYLLSNKILGSTVNVQTLATDASCFQCLGERELFAMEVFLWCQLAISL